VAINRGKCSGKRFLRSHGTETSVLTRDNTAMKTRFILIETSHAGNVGAVARAMKTMGFDDLVLVAPRWANVLRREETIQRASGALDVLAQARIVATLDDALGGMTHLCATAMTPRDFGPPTRSPREHFEMLSNQELLAPNSLGLAGDISCKNGSGEPFDGVVGKSQPASHARGGSVEGMAFLFGPERFGMKNEDVYRCHVALRIPSNAHFGSLNLAAAVQLIAYEWREVLGGFESDSSVHDGLPAAPRRLADAAEVAGLLAHWEQALVGVGFLDPAAPKKLLPRLNQLLNRAALSPEEIHILRGVAKAVLARC
jgi:tRNA/rRNA methyltransferase